MSESDPRRVFITGEVSDQVAEQVIDDLIRLSAASPKPIDMLICSEGGDIYSMFAIHDVMCSVRAPIHTFAVGKAMSSGAVLLAAGDVRVAYPNSQIMIHEAQQTNLADMGVAQFKSEMAHFSELNRRMASLLATYTKKEEKAILDRLQGETGFYLTAEEAMEYGLVDKVLPNKKSTPPAKTTRRK